MTTLFQTSEANPIFSTRGNGRFGNVTRTGWIPSKLGDKKKEIIIDALKSSDVDQVYKKGNRICALYLNGTEKQIS